MLDRRGTFGDLEKIDGHPNYYRNPRSGVIYFKKSGRKFSTGEKKIMAAKRVVEERLALEAASGNVGQVQRKLKGELNPLISDLKEEFFATKATEVTESTMMTYRQNWDYGMKGFWGDKRVLDITDANLIKFKAWYLESNPTRVFDHTAVHLKAIFDYIRAQKLILSVPDFNLLRGVKEAVVRNSKRVKVGRVYKEEEIAAMLKAANQLSPAKRPYARLGILLGARAGLRKMEALTLEWKHVDLKKRSMTVWSRKNHKWRDIPLAWELVEAFKAMPRDNAAGLIFPKKSNPSEPLSSQLFDKMWVAVKAFAGITGKARFHDLRHTFATRTAEEGWPPIVACSVLDQSFKVYQGVYCKPSFESKSDLIDRTFDQKSSTLVLLKDGEDSKGAK